MSLYPGFFHSSFIAAIQEFWFVIVDAADRIATSPLLPSVLAIICTCLAPMSGVDEAFRCMMRPALAIALSNEITLMPRSIAFLPTGTSALASLAETMMPSTFWAMRASITVICQRAGAGRQESD